MQSNKPSESRFPQKKFEAAGKAVTLYPAAEADRKLIVLNTYSGDGESMMKELAEVGKDKINLLVIGNLDWDNDLTPWSCAALSENEPPFQGRANEYLNLLLSEILPEAMALIPGSPSRIGLAGYSLAGLFALYAAMNCDVFDSVASISGSLWFPGFVGYVTSHGLSHRTKSIYLSLGDREAKSRHPMLKTVREHTEAIAQHYRELGVNVIFELNPGNHYSEIERRTLKGILSI